jgi:hypothetical protein
MVSPLRIMLSETLVTFSWGFYNNLSLEVIFLKQLFKIKYFELQNFTSK